MILVMFFCRLKQKLGLFLHASANYNGQRGWEIGLTRWDGREGWREGSGERGKESEWAVKNLMHIIVIYS